MMRPHIALISGLCLLAGPAIADEPRDPKLALLENTKPPGPAGPGGAAAARRDPAGKRAGPVGRLSQHGRMTALLIFLGSASGGGALGLLAK
ncbi:MAG: hypothetical protein AAGD47_04235 [Pseudomonadota bacterium]